MPEQPEQEARFQLRVPADLLKQFDAIAQREDLTRSQAMRRLMRRYVADNAQTDFVDDGRGRRGRKGGKK